MKPHRRWMRLGTATLLLIAASSGTSCGRPDMAERRVPNATAGHGPVLQLADTIILEESDSLFLGKPGYTFAVDEQGMMYVPDLFVDHVIQYTAAGKAARVYGKHGRGPGELSRLGATFVLDSFLIQDIGRALVVFDRRTGKFLYNRPYRGNVAGLALVSGRIWLGNFDPTSQRGLAGREATEFFRDSSGAAYEPLMSTKVPFPEQYGRYRGLEMFNLVAVSAVRGGVGVGFAGSNALLIFDPASNNIDTVDVPFVARRGVTTAGLRVLGSRAPFDEQLAAISALAGLWAMSDGRILLWYADNSAQREGRDGLKNFSGRAFMSILSPDRTRACVDTELPVPGSRWPRITFARDTLYLLDQVVPETGAVRAVSVVRRYTVEAGGCEWLPVRTGRGQ